VILVEKLKQLIDADPAYSGISIIREVIDTLKWNDYKGPESIPFDENLLVELEGKSISSKNKYQTAIKLKCGDGSSLVRVGHNFDWDEEPIVRWRYIKD